MKWPQVLLLLLGNWGHSPAVSGESKDCSESGKQPQELSVWQLCQRLGFGMEALC